MRNADTTTTLCLPKQDAAFAEAYARAHGLTVSEMIGRYLCRIQKSARHSPAPELESITGLVPVNVNAEEEHRYFRVKHSADLPYPGRDGSKNDVLADDWPDGYFEQVFGGWEGEPLQRKKLDR